MDKNQIPPTEKAFGCETCPMRQKAEANPKSFIARLWRWHTTWCPGWKEYQTHLAEQANKKYSLTNPNKKVVKSTFL